MAATPQRRKASKLIGTDSARASGTLHALSVAAPAPVLVDDSEPSAAAMMAEAKGGKPAGKPVVKPAANKAATAGKQSVQANKPAPKLATIAAGASVSGGSASKSKSGSSPRDGDPDLAYAFKVMINSVTYAMFSEIGGLSWKAEAIPVRSGGNNEHSYNMRGPGKFEPLTIKRGWFASNGEFFDMMKASLSGSTPSKSAGAGRANITISVLNRKYQPIGEYQVFNAFITEYSGLALNSMSSQVGFEQIRMVYDYFVYKAM